MRATSRFCILCVLLIMLGVSGLQSPIHAAQPSQSYKALDILFLVEQSALMAGQGEPFNGEGDGKDPSKMRFIAVQQALDWLGFFRAEQHSLGNDIDIQAAVLNFGGQKGNLATTDKTLEVTLPFTPLIPNNVADWQQQRETILNAASADNFVKVRQAKNLPANLGNRDFQAGFTEAFRMFAALGTRPTPRQKVIFVIIGGVPCAPDKRPKDTCANRDARVTYMEDLVNQVTPNFADGKIWVAAIDDKKPASSAYWAGQSNYGQFWREIAVSEQRAIAVDNSVQLGAFMVDALITTAQDYTVRASESQYGIDLQLPNPQSENVLPVEVGLRPLVVPPYQQVLSLTIVKSILNTEVIVRSPNGEAFKPVDGNSAANDAPYRVYGLGSYIETWRIFNPTPGQWQIGTNALINGVTQADPGASANASLIRARFEAKGPEGEQNAYLPIDIQLSALDFNGHVLPAYSGDDGLKGEVTISSPDGEEITLPLEKSNEQATDNVYHIRYTPFFAGKYTATIKATAGSDANAITYQSPVPLNFNVETTTPKIEGLKSDALEGETQDYTLSFTDPADQLVNAVKINTFEVKYVAATNDCNAVALETQRSENPVTMPVSLTLSYEKPGEYKVCAKVDIADTATAAGTTRTVFNRELGVVNVIGIEKLAFVIDKPERRPLGNDSEIKLTDLETKWLLVGDVLYRPYWEAQPVRFEVSVVKASQPSQRMPIKNDLTPADANQLFTLTLLDSNNNDLAKNYRFEPTDNPAVWAVVIDALAAGDYTLTIKAKPGAVSSTNQVFLAGRNGVEGTDQRSFRVVVEANSLPVAVQIGGYVLAFLFAFGIVGEISQVVYKRLNPVKGTLAIVRVSSDGTRSLVGSPYNLNNRNLNHIRIPLAKLPLMIPPMLGLEARTVRLQKGRVRVTYWMQSGKITNRPKPSEKTLEDGSPSNKQVLIHTDRDGNQYWIYLNPLAHEMGEAA